jgi:branched-chain amino acid transport system substrate-binding protein
MQRRNLILVCLSVTLALFSCVSQHPVYETAPVRIGFFGDLSAAGATEGNDALKGSGLRVAQINAAGGIGGRKVELYSVDARQSTTEAVKAYTQLVQDDGVCAVIGTGAPSSGIAVSSVADLSHVPFVSLNMDDRVTTPDVKADSPERTGAPRPYTFLVQASAIQSAEGLAWYTVEHLALNRFATLFDAVNPVSVLQARAFERVVKASGKEVAASVALPEGDLGSVVRALASARADAVYVCASVEKDAAAARVVRQSFPQLVLLGNQAWYAPLTALAGDAANNAWFSMPVSPDDPGVAEIAPAFAARFGEVLRPAAAAGWDAVGVIVAAVRKAGTSDPVRVRDTLEQAVSFKVLQGQLDMDRGTHRPAFPVVAIMKIEGSAYRTVEPRFVHRPPRT